MRESTQFGFANTKKKNLEIQMYRKLKLDKYETGNSTE